MNMNISPKTVYYALKYIFYGLSRPTIVDRLESEMDRLVFRVLLTNIYLNP